MPRSATLTVKDINRRRGSNWEWHYKNRQRAKLYSSDDAQRVSRIISGRVPAPVLLIDASLLDGIEHVRTMSNALECVSSSLPRCMMCIWYWSEEGWMEFVREFQALPDVTESYYMFYDEALDAMQLYPLSTIGKNRGHKSQVHLRYKSGTSVALVPGARVRARV